MLKKCAYGNFVPSRKQMLASGMSCVTDHTMTEDPLTVYCFCG